MSERVQIEYGDDVIVMSWDGAQASAPIKVDGVSTQYQTADARHRIEEAVRLACKATWPEDRDWSDGSEAWDAMAYETIS